MFNIGPGELIAISMVALIVLGPQRLPHAVRTVGRVVGELRRISGGFQDELRNALDDSELDELRRARPDLDLTPPSLPPLPDDLGDIGDLGEKLPRTTATGGSATGGTGPGAVTSGDSSIPPALRDAGSESPANGSGTPADDAEPVTGDPAALAGTSPPASASPKGDDASPPGSASPPDDAPGRPAAADPDPHDSAPTAVDGEAPPAGGTAAAAS